MKRPWRLLVGTIALLALAAAPRPVSRPAPAPELLLPQALALVPDTPDTRAVGVWYNDFALAERTYGVLNFRSMTNPLIARYFNAIVALRPGPETGVSDLVRGRWRQIYGYDLFTITSEVYCPGSGTPNRPIAVDVGDLDLAYIAHVLATSGYTPTTIGPDRFFVRTPAQAMPTRAMNAVALTGGRLIAGATADDVIRATRRMQLSSGTLGMDPGYKALAAALGPVEGAYVAANVPPSPYDTSPFTPPSRGHRGPRLHPFSLYATADLEPRPGLRYMELALVYRRGEDARADVPTLRARLRRESLPVDGARWAQEIDLASMSVSGRVLVARLRLRPDVPPTLWQDVVQDGELSILSP